MDIEDGVLEYVEKDDLELLKSNPDKFWEGVTKIGAEAFRGCSSLTSIAIPEGVTKIEAEAFRDCSSLTSITIPNSVTDIGEWTFRDCSSLTSITIPEGVTKIGEYAFRGCSSLTSITIPNSVTEIGEGAFKGCSSLTSINIPDSVTEIGFFAFWGCSSLTSITIPEGVTEIGTAAFRDCSSLTSITIPNSVTEIKSYAFKGCSSLTSITIPSSVTKIGENAFRDCSSLTSITIPDSVRRLGDNAFWGCSSLTSINIPDSVTEIEWNAFRDCSSLTSITIPEGVTDIGGSAFEGCPNLCLIFKNFENVKHPIHALLNANFKYAYINKSGEVVFSHQKEPNYEDYLKFSLTETPEMTIKKDNDYFQVGLSDVTNKNFIKNLVQATEWKKQGEVKFIPPNYTLSVFPPDQFDKYYLNKNNKRWADLVKATGLGTLNGQEKYNSLVDLMKIYYALGGFSEKQGEREEAFKYVFKHVAISHDEYDSSPQAIGAEIHRRFSGLVLKGAYNPDFAKFFMRYYHENPDFMMFNIDDHEQDYLCKAHNNFALIQSMFPNRVVSGNTKRDLLSPQFLAEHCDIVKYNNIDKGNEALAMLVGRYGYSQDQFDQMQGIYNVAKGLKDKYVIQADRAKAENGISFRVLEKDDPLGFVLGDITNCCQRIGDAGGSCVDDGYRNPNAGFLVFEEEIKDENGQPTGEYQILAQAYIWYDPENKTVCYDNIEIPTKILKALREGKQLSTEGLMKSLTESADAIMSAMNRNGVEVKKVTTGQGYNDLREELEKEYGAPERSQIAQHRDYFGYSDAKGAQYMIRTYDQTTKLYASSIKNEIEKAGEDIKTIGLSLAQKE